MLLPKRVKFRRVHRGRMTGKDYRRSRVINVQNSLPALIAAWITNKNIDYDSILSGFQRKRLENEILADNRKAEIYEKIPEIKKIDQEIASSSIQAARNRIRKLPVNMEDINKNNRELAAYKKALLKEHGYPENYLEPIYECPLCHDTGYQGSHPCKCMTQKEIDELYNQSTIREILERENFSTFSLNYYSRENDGTHKHTPYENASNTLAACKDYVEHFDESHSGILIYGETGLGKTFLSNCIAKALLDKGHTVLYLTSINLFENNLSGIIMGNVREKEKMMLYDYIYNCELLIIDDLGTEVPNTFVNSQLFEIINMRNNRSLATLISTNLSMRELSDRYTERIMSRIIGDFKVFPLYGTNIRYTKRKDRIQNKTSN